MKRLIKPALIGLGLGLIVGAGLFTHRHYEDGKPIYEAGDCLLVEENLQILAITEVTETTYKYDTCIFIFCGKGEMIIRDFNREVRASGAKQVDCETLEALDEPAN